MRNRNHHQRLTTLRRFIYDHRRQPNASLQDTIANFGPHGWIPEWTLATVQRLAGTNPFAFMVLAPLVSLSSDTDRTGAEEAFAAAWIGSGVLDQVPAAMLAREWARCAVVEG
jgi:hypothetical protein